MDRAVVEARLDRGADQAVLVDPRETLELRSADHRPKVVAAALVDHLDVGAGQRVLDHRLQLGEIGHQLGDPAFAASTISWTRQNLTRGRPCGSPAATSAWSIACQPM